MLTFQNLLDVPLERAQFNNIQQIVNIAPRRVALVALQDAILVRLSQNPGGALPAGKSNVYRDVATAIENLNRSAIPQIQQPQF